MRDVSLAAATAALLAAASLAAAPPPSPDQGQAQGLALTACKRSATLSCDGIAHGTHPLPLPACTALSAADGDFDALPGQPAVCRDPYAPITVAAREARRSLAAPGAKRRLSFNLRELREAGLARVLVPVACFELGNLATTFLILRATTQLEATGRSATAATSLAILMYAAHNAAARTQPWREASINMRE